RRVQLPSVTARVALLQALRERPAPVTLARPAYFCSGCPHNRSTVVPEGSLAGGGIGCHGLVLTMNRGTLGITHMGGEGAQWVGARPSATHRPASRTSAAGRPSTRARPPSPRRAR